MPAIGAPLRKWTLCLLLLCSLSPCTFAQSANDTAAVATGSAARSSAATRASSSTASPPKSSALVRVDSLCPSRTINYITHTLPQQCLRTDWAASGQASTAEGSTEAATTPALEVVIPWAREEVVDGGEQGTQDGTRPSGSSLPEETNTPDPAEKSDTTSTQAEVELETDSPFDNADFLSFEEWKKKNLAQVGQSPENVGQGRASSSEQRPRRRPVNVNALDSLGEEGEIEIDFSGFGNPPEGEPGPSSASSERRESGDAATVTDGEGKAAPSSWALSKDAGKTCKERFNYASFDCAATVLKTNPKAKSTSSILVENKDSYMLNECSAENKFLIVELCDDILLDTIVLANYEFFSSMFRHVRVSVSDRYPVKMDRWRVLGTFEARNSRDIQPFLVTEPQIWARYLRIEFLTHYGNEFYCPMSLLRVHGTTMMEQFRREEEQARGDDDFADPIEGEGVPVQTAVPSEDELGSTPGEQIPVQSEKDGVDVSSHTKDSAVIPDPTEDSAKAKGADTSSEPPAKAPVQPSVVSSPPAVPSNQVAPPSEESTESPASPSSHVPENPKEPGSSDTPKKDVVPPSDSADTASTRSSETDAKANGSMSVSAGKGVKSATNETATVASSVSAGKSSNSTSNGSQAQPQARSSTQTHPIAATPTTQESFFKSIHKRLQYLEANSTLSLQYIEEQSRILRDAFIKVEKNQLQKTEKFLDHLNSTVMQELKSYRNMYDQLWQSTILELEGMKERQKTEMGEIGARLSMVADELVWQKRMAVVQSTLLLLCLGLVLFVRSGSLGSQLGTTYSNFFDETPHSPVNSGLLKRRRTFRNMWRSDTSAVLSDRSGHFSDAAHAVSDVETDGRRSPVNVEFSPPTPITPDISSSSHKKSDFFPEHPYNNMDKGQDAGTATPTEETLEDDATRIQVLETQSGPATPRGSRDNRPSWEEVDRAVDLLKAEGQGQNVQHEQTMSREKRKRRSPLRRAESYNGAASDSPEEDGAEGLYFGD
jgi:hypothetical protein